jgi:hypothetical protein
VDQREDDRRRLGVRLHYPWLRDWDCRAEAFRRFGGEISDSLRDKDPYLIIVRWNGPLADFTYLLNIKGEKYRVATGDVMKATIVGDLITAYKNGVEIGQAKDNTYLNGLPGFGFNEGRNGDYGITRFSVAATNASGTAARLAGQTSRQ